VRFLTPPKIQFVLAATRRKQSASRVNSKRWGWCTLKSIFLALILVPVLAKIAYTQDAKLFPKSSFGGFLEFEFAPPHNEWDLNRCAANAGSPSYGGAGAPCTAFARGMLGTRLEFKPINVGPFKKLYVFIAPQSFFGDNLPQTRYSFSFDAIGLDRTDGLIYELPAGFEATLTQHAKMYWFGKYQKSLGPADLNNSPFGQFNSVGLRWRFGTFRSVH
jgi:hypothetical protein